MFVAGKNKGNGTGFAPRFVALIVSCALVVTAAVSVYYAFRFNQENKKILASQDVLTYTAGDELAELKIDAKIRENIEAAYATYQADMQNMLAIAAIIFTLFSIGVPLMQYEIMTKERIKEFDDKMEKFQKEEKAIQDKFDEKLEKMKKIEDRFNTLEGELSQIKTTYATVTYEQYGKVAVDTIIRFGGYEWMVLDINEKSQALLITKDIITKLPYHESGGNITWEHCSLRAYLNTELYEQFDEDDRNKIVEIQNKNPNTIYVTANGGLEVNTRGGNRTPDNIFLLSIEEAKRYFHTTERETSAHLENVFPKTYPQSNDLVAEYGKEAEWWWLRSPGHCEESAATVYKHGDMDIYGYGVANKEGGVRPALWLNLEQ